MPERRNRRDFVRTLTLGGTAALATSPVVADDPEKAPTEVDARMDYLLARFGKQLDAEARQTIRAEVETLVHRAEALRKFPLDNGDGPFPVFTPYRAPIVP